jgi:hypothetical protein
MNANADALEAEANKLINEKSEEKIVVPGKLDAVGNPIYELRSDALLRQAKDIRRGLATSKTLPNTIMLDRPRRVKHLKWVSKNGEPLENNIRLDIGQITEGIGIQDNGIKKLTINAGSVKGGTFPWADNAVAAWLEFASMMKLNDVYKDMSIPAIKSGFILSILVGFLGVIPKACFYFLKLRFAFLNSIKGLKKLPFNIGKPIYGFLKFLIDLLTAIPALLNSAFISICIWLSLMPNKYMPNVSDDEDINVEDTHITDNMEVGDTPAGFVSLDCIVAAQTIVNRVHEEALTDG